ncbi:hypothetical protein LTR97_012493 [Elasticomyces elasticus]|uniref:Uncharacterized protein n=1 Tax=Elasticomyces elasticus TaxID=574655 RepID=A0AAN7VKT6_9PEZI|nr:hypothetical protein LTR97_012493 [Elasticomyces elasticus]
MAQPPTRAMRQARRDLFRRFSAIRDLPMLMDLPAELRDIIFTFALAEQEPIIAYCEQRTVRRLRGSFHDLGQGYHQTELARECRPQPPLPPLALMKEEVSCNAFPIYLRENVFHFFIDDRSIGEVGAWKSAMEQAIHFYWKQPGNLDMNIWKHLTIRLEFRLMGRDSSHRVATIEYSLSKDSRRIDLRFGAALEAECTCWILDTLDDVFYDCDDRYVLGRFAEYAERLLVNVWKEFERTRVPSRVCTTCGKEHYETVQLLKTLARLRENVDILDDPEICSNALPTSL